MRMPRDLQLTAKVHTMVVCYDISSNKHRRKISPVLEDHGVRIQESVFEIRVTEPQFERLAAKLRPLVAGVSDRLRMVPLAAGLGAEFGLPSPVVTDGPWLLLGRSFRQEVASQPVTLFDLA